MKTIIKSQFISGREKNIMVSMQLPLKKLDLYLMAEARGVQTKNKKKLSHRVINEAYLGMERFLDC